MKAIAPGWLWTLPGDSTPRNHNVSARCVVRRITTSMVCLPNVRRTYLKTKGCTWPSPGLHSTWYAGCYASLSLRRAHTPCIYGLHSPRFRTLLAAPTRAHTLRSTFQVLRASTITQGGKSSNQTDVTKLLTTTLQFLVPLPPYHPHPS